MISQFQTGFYGLAKLWAEAWASTAAYTVGDVVKASTYNSHTYKCTTAGNSSSVEPSWGTTDGGTTSDGTVIWTCYDPKTYNVVAPQGSSTPYITFGQLTEVPIGDFQDFEAVENITYYVNCFSDKSVADVSEIADEVMDALDDKIATVSGYTCMKCVREFTGNVIYDSETNIYQMPLRYRLYLDKT